jgi:hypothetical protein
MTAISLIVMEPGSEWPGHFGGCDDVVAIGQHGDGLLQRTRQEIATVHARGHHVRVAVLACNEAFGSAASARRGEVVAELLGALEPRRFSRLLLSAPERASLSFRSDILSLVGTLGRALRDRAATVSVRFGTSAQALAQRPVRHGVSTSSTGVRAPRPTGLVRARVRPEG